MAAGWGELGAEGEGTGRHLARSRVPVGPSDQ